MAFLIDQLNNSGLFAQSAYSAGIATCDSDGNIITATYLTGVDLTPYQTTAGMTAYATTGDVSSTEWNSVYETVETNSGSWTETSFPASADEAVQYIQTNSGDLDDTLTSYQTYSGNVTGQYVPYNRTFLGMYNIPSGLYVSSNTTTASIGTTPMSFNIKDRFNNTYLNPQFLRVSSNVDNIDTLYINKGFVVVNHKNNTSAYAYFDNISSWNDATTTYQTNSGTYLTAHQDISANEWNETYETVQTNSASWADGSTYTGDAQGALDEVYSNSSKWNNTYTTYKNNSATYLTGVDLTPYQTTAGMTGYLTTGQYETDSAVFNAKQDALTFGYDTNDAISSINNSAITQPPSQKLYLQSPLTTGVSAGSAYIGIEPSAMYNETVLWSGTAAPSNFPLTMSEPFSAFEKIEFIWDARYNGDYGTPTKGTIIYTDNHGSTMPTKYTLVEAYANGNQAWWDWWYLENNDNGKTLTNYKALYFPMTGGSSATQTNCRLFKVVGINRKENS